MKFAIITHVPHGIEDDKYYAYSPYVREMNIWSKHIDELLIVAPLCLNKKTDIDFDYQAKVITFFQITQFNFLSLFSSLKAVFRIPIVLLTLYKAMKKSDHIHLRCPGNVGLMACIVQIFFPNKSKTAKYAGNWDPKAIQPISYRMQKWILSNTFLTKNMQVLIYGEWKNQTKNIKPFFTATYSESEKNKVTTKDFNKKIKFLFVGTLTPGKRTLYAIQLVEELSKNYKNMELNIFGNGEKLNEIQKYIDENSLNDYIFLRGNKSKEQIKNEYIGSHFLILPSKSEGWPKVVAEAMFWGCLPIATPVSCISSMLDEGNRGLLLELELKKDVAKIEQVIKNKELYNQGSILAMHWSRKYTTDFFEDEIKKIMQKEIS